MTEAVATETPAELTPPEQVEAPDPMAELRKESDDFRSKAAAERKVNRDLETKLSAAQDLIDKLNGAKPSEDAMRVDAEKAATAKVAERIIRSEIRAAATGKLADPNDAHKFLDMSQFSVDDNGDVDSAELTWAIDDLVKRKGYLAAQTEASKSHGSADGGVRKGSKPEQITLAQVKQMHSDDIEAARLAGRLNDVLGVK